jgi:hypothetical protein
MAAVGGFGGGAAGDATRTDGLRTKALLFKKKRSKKLLLPVPLARLASRPAVNRSFLLLFLKKEALSFSLCGGGLRRPRHIATASRTVGA